MVYVKFRGTLENFLAFLREGRYTIAHFNLRDTEVTADVPDKYIGECELPEHIECVDNSITLTLIKGNRYNTYTFDGLLFPNQLEMHCL
jgi:hypothetical protein